MLRDTEDAETEALVIVPAAVLDTVGVVVCSITYVWPVNKV